MIRGYHYLWYIAKNYINTQVNFVIAVFQDMEDYTVGGNFTTNETIAIASRKNFDLSHV